MPTIQSNVTIAAGATNENLIAGSQFEFAPYDASIELALIGSAAGLVADVSTGQDVVAEALTVNPANRFPIMPDDFLIQDVVQAGERIKIRARNTTAGTLTINYCVRIFPLRRA